MQCIAIWQCLLADFCLFASGQRLQWQYFGRMWGSNNYKSNNYLWIRNHSNSYPWIHCWNSEFKTLFIQWIHISELGSIQIHIHQFNPWIQCVPFEFMCEFMIMNSYPWIHCWKLKPETLNSKHFSYNEFSIRIHIHQFNPWIQCVTFEFICEFMIMNSWLWIHSYELGSIWIHNHEFSVSVFEFNNEFITMNS